MKNEESKYYLYKKILNALVLGNCENRIPEREKRKSLEQSSIDIGGGGKLQVSKTREREEYVGEGQDNILDNTLTTHMSPCMGRHLLPHIFFFNFFNQIQISYLKASYNHKFFFQH